MSVFVESNQRFDGLARRAAAFRATGSNTGRWRARGEPLLVNRSRHAEDAEKSQAALRQRVGERLDERRQLVGRVVVDEDDLVVGVA